MILLFFKYYEVSILPYYGADFVHTINSNVISIVLILYYDYDSVDFFNSI